MSQPPSPESKARADLWLWVTWKHKRDEVVSAAFDAGIRKSEIYRITGISRPCIDRIIARFLRRKEL